VRQAWSDLFYDLRFAARQLLQRPVFSAAVVLIVALATGANTAVFSVVRAVLLESLPYRDSGRLQWITTFVPRINSQTVFSPVCGLA
jgi:putative ABC transport system permease protein